MSSFVVFAVFADLGNTVANTPTSVGSAVQPSFNIYKRGSNAAFGTRGHNLQVAVISFIILTPSHIIYVLAAAAKLAAAAAGGLRVVGLQHDGIALVGAHDGEEAEVARRLSAAATAACGYDTAVVVERVRVEGDAA